MTALNATAAASQVPSCVFTQPGLGKREVADIELGKIKSTSSSKAKNSGTN